MALCNEVFEQVTEDEIVFVPTKKTPILTKVISPLYKEMIEWCRKHNRNMDDFIEFAIQRELDFQNGEMRYVIKDLLRKQKTKRGMMYYRDANGTMHDIEELDDGKK